MSWQFHLFCQHSNCHHPQSYIIHVPQNGIMSLQSVSAGLTLFSPHFVWRYFRVFLCKCCTDFAFRSINSYFLIDSSRIKSGTNFNFRWMLQIYPRENYLLPACCPTCFWVSIIMHEGVLCTNIYAVKLSSIVVGLKY